MRRLTAIDRLTRPVDSAGLGPYLRPLALLGAAACWGAGTVVSKQAVGELPPITLLAAQLSVSVAALGLGAAVRRRSIGGSGSESPLLARLGLLNPGLAYALSLIGLTQISASLSVLLWATEPLLILLLAVAVLGERVGRRFVVATGVALAGLVLVVFDPTASGALPGVLLSLAGVGVCAIYTIATRKLLPGTSDSTFAVVLGQQVHALVLILLVLVGLGVGGQAILPAHLTIAGAASAAVSGLLYYAVAYLCYLFALRSIPASVASASFYLVPVFGVTFAAMAGERLEPIQWLGAALVVLAVAAATLQPRTARPAAVA